jgi:hypothetical protein
LEKYLTPISGHSIRRGLLLSLAIFFVMQPDILDVETVMLQGNVDSKWHCPCYNRCVMSEVRGHQSVFVSPSVPTELVNIVRAGVKAGREVPGAVALGGTICSLYAGHRLSLDIDFGVSDLRDRFQQVREHLLEVDGWREADVRVPVLILGSIEGVEIGFRQLRRNTPFDTVLVKTADGDLVVPTLGEMLLTKAFLIYNRNYTRDFVDFAELACLDTDAGVVEALSKMDGKFAWSKQPSVVLGVLKTLLHAEPADSDTHGYSTFRWLAPKLSSWQQVQAKCRAIGELLANRLVGAPP